MSIKDLQYHIDSRALELLEKELRSSIECLRSDPILCDFMVYDDRLISRIDSLRRKLMDMTPDSIRRMINECSYDELEPRLYQYAPEFVRMIVRRFVNNVENLSSGYCQKMFRDDKASESISD